MGFVLVSKTIAYENIRFSSLFAAGDVSSPGAKSEEKRIFSQATKTTEKRSQFD